MVVKRKKTTIDSTDRDILRHMSQIRRNLTGNALAKKVNLSGAAIAPRLRNLQSQGIIKRTKTLKMRNFSRTFPGKSKSVNIKAPRSIFWGLDLKKPSRQIKRKPTQLQLKNLARGRKILAKKRK